jgi:DNA topoisomerase-3
MGKALIIAEKPSVAGDIAKALGGFKRSDEYFESDQFVLSSAVGHLLELVCPEQFEARRGKWTFTHLPVLPPHFDLAPIEKSEGRLKVLQKLLKRKDVDRLINACDAGREGELIFRRIVEHTKSKLPIQRLWLQSMTPGAIRSGFEQLRSDPELRPLADAAEARAEADWLVGINGTRGMTAFNSKQGGFHLTTVGRVQTPTLAIVVEREDRIRKFVSRDYWEVIGTFQAAAGLYQGRWFDEGFTKVAGGKDSDDPSRAERLWEKSRADALRDKCLGRPGIVSEESKPTTQIAPMLYDLTTLQREANGRFGLSASRTLQLAQSLYERHKVLTYPRTDSRALPEDYLATVRETMETLKATGYGKHAGEILEQGWVRPNKRIFNNARISDHFAIIPTTLAPKHLTDIEQKLYDMVTKRFLAVFYPAAEFLVTTRITRVEGEPFKSEGKVLVSAGWMTVYGKEAQAEDDAPNLAPVSQGETVDTKDVEVKGSQTKPPARFTEATLLSAMEGAGKLVEDDELRSAMAEKGLGTPATRASIIEGLVHEHYIVRNGKELVPTAKAFSLITLLNGLQVTELTKPELTGDWEFKLRQIQRGQLPREAFMQEIREFTERIVGKAKQYEHDTIPGDFGVLKIRCPKCGGEVHENYKKFQCQACDFALWKIISGRQFEIEEVEALIRDRQVGPLQGFRSKMGKPFAALMRLNELCEAKFDFGEDRKTGENGESVAVDVDFTGREQLGVCPKCQARVFAHGTNYVCEKSVGKERTCKFRTGAVILQQAVEPPQLKKLLETGKTDLLKGFISRKTGRKFEAFLVLKDGEVSFEFAPREKKARGGKASAKSTEPVVKLDFSGQESLGKCPRCSGRVFEGPDAYVCENSQAETRACKFKTGKVVLQQPIDREQVAKLLTDGRTDELAKFISRAGRPFKATLKLGERGKVDFEFPER